MGFGSCATLEDGISRVCKGNNVGELDLIPDDEEALLRELEELDQKLSTGDDPTEGGTPKASPADSLTTAETIPASEEELRDNCGDPKLPAAASEPGEQVERTPVATPARARPADTETPQPNSVEPTVPSAEVSVPAPGGKPTKPKKVLTRQDRLRLQAKARIIRMVKPKTKRKDLEAPQYVIDEWKTGNKNAIADLLKEANFCQEKFFNTLQIMIRKKQSVELLVDEGWFCEAELRDDHGWSQQKIDGAKAHCMSMGDSHCRRNCYDGQQEFWVVLKETGKRKEKHSFEETHQKRQKANGEPTWNMADVFKGKGVEGFKERTEAAATAKLTFPDSNKYSQTKDALKKFLESMMSKSGKMRGLVRELRTQFKDPNAEECAKTLEAEIKKIDAQYDLCNEAWAKGEQEKFWGDEFFKLAEKRMKDATFVCSKAAAHELKVRNAKKYYEKKSRDERWAGKPPGQVKSVPRKAKK